MRRFSDLHLCSSIGNYEQVKGMVKKSFELGYRLVGIPMPVNISSEAIDRIRNICNEANIDLATRVNIISKTSHELLSILRHFRRKFDIVCVVCTSKRVARQAAKDRRVDLLSYGASEPRKRYFDKTEAELASKALSSLEIEIAPLLTLDGFSRIRLLSKLREEVKIAERFDVPITISSGATDENHIRSPHDCVALATLFDMPTQSAICSLSENPFSIVRRNRGKLGPDYVAPGIKLVGRKKSG